MKKNCEYNDDPFFRYSLEEKQRMSKEELDALIEEHNEYVRKKQSLLNEQAPPKFNTIEELMDYYDAIPFDEAVNKMNELFNK